MFNTVKGIRKIKAKMIRNANLELKSEMEWEIGLIRGLVERYNHAIVYGDVTSEKFYEQELKQKELRLNDIKAMLA